MVGAALLNAWIRDKLHDRTSFFISGFKSVQYDFFFCKAEQVLVYKI